MSELYLVAHKVRGEPAFDIAIMLDVLDEDGDMMWIIPTSGHRAYPWWWTDLTKLQLIDETDVFMSDGFDNVCGTMPPDLQDHYHLDAPRPTVKLIDRLNLRTTLPPIVRRF